MGYRVREAIAKGIPYICVIGKKEMADSTVSVRRLGENKPVSMKVDGLVKAINEDVVIKNRGIN
jgi:threonyl-tRNA synthetase